MGGYRFTPTATQHARVAAAKVGERILILAWNIVTENVVGTTLFMPPEYAGVVALKYMSPMEGLAGENPL